jgi:transposase InsO family protein
MDLCGPITPISRGGNRYFLKIIDGYTKYRFVFPMRCKSDTFRNFQIFLNQAETHTGLKLKNVVSDNGGEFCNKQFKHLFEERGIQHLTSAPYTPQQNPMAERGNRTTVEKT